jgi:limonene-1,2-epoxide hydrolase
MQGLCLLIVSRRDNAMPGPAEVVREFCSGIGRKDLAAIEALLDEKVVYHNIGQEPAVDRDATLDALRFQFDMFEPIAFKIRHLAVAGDTVLTERVDEITANGITAPVPVMGTFEVRDGRIVAWRDYFDVGLTGKLMAGENVDSLLPG